MRKPLIATAVAGIAGLGLIAGGTALAAAQDPSPSPSASPSLGSGEIRVDDDDSGGTVSASSIKISREQAVQIAKQRIGDPDARFDTELEREHGALVWDVELNNARGEHEIDVDAKTGKIVRYDLDADDRDDRGDDGRDDDGRDDRGDDRMDDSGHDAGDDHGGDRDDGDDDSSGHGRGGDDDHDDDSGHGSDD